MKKVMLYLQALFLGACVMAAVPVQAAVPTGVSTAFTALQSDAEDIADLAVPVVIGVLALTVVIKLIKRFANKI